MIRAGVFGATGYTGAELVRLLQRHPQVALVFVTSESSAGRTLRDIYPSAPALPLIRGADADLGGVDVVFLCLPHAASAETAVRCLAAGCRVIDLSADFRLRDVAVYEQWYKVTHPAPALLDRAVYGLTEINRAHLPGADLVACPGCYPTSILLPLYPLVTRGLVGGPIIADSKSGVSGAGRKASVDYHFVEVGTNLKPYSIGRIHRHLPEIEQELHGFHPAAPRLIFSPHLIPIPRGIISTIYAPLTDPALTPAALHGLLAEVYSAEPFIDLLPPGQAATVHHVVHTNRCAIGLTRADDTLIITSAIDNLVKGAAGQAVQNLNAMLGLDETTGLL